MIGDWIRLDNLRVFLEVLARECGCSFDDRDWRAVADGVAHSAHEAGRWFEYIFCGVQEVHLRLALEGDGVWISLVAAPAVEARLDVAVGLMQRYTLSPPDKETQP